MKEYYPAVGIKRLCRLFGKTRNAFYDHQRREESTRFEEALIVDLVKSHRTVMPKVGGAKLLLMLKRDFTAHKIVIGRDSFFDLLRKHNLLIKRKPRYVRTTDSNHAYYKWPDRTKGFKLKAPEQLWVSDITYLRTANGFVYLSLITDAWSHKIIGHHLSQSLKTQGCIIALNKAISTLSPGHTPIHHSDRGIQYCSEPYVTVLRQNNIGISMTQTGSPYDNAVAERVNGILKNELMLEETFSTYSEAAGAVHYAIDTYNRIRPHMTCGNLTPQTAHKTTEKFKKLWKDKTYGKAKPVLL
ncbi:MAG: IS3 family transposase [Pedobacter sp.]|nr:MAG: IS3 family transposase [Pedobacter sp.]